MKKLLPLICLVAGLSGVLGGCGADSLVLPPADTVSCIRVTTGDEMALQTQRAWIEGFLSAAGDAISVGQESTQDTPDRPDAVKIELEIGGESAWSVLYAYEENGICCLQQPYQGIYTLNKSLRDLLAGGGRCRE